MIIDFIVFLFLLLFWYIVLVAGTYVYAVVKNYELTKMWTFKIKDGYLGVCKCPRYITYWLDVIVLFTSWKD